MKKTIFLMVIMSFFLVACGSEDTSGDVENDSNLNEEEEILDSKDNKSSAQKQAEWIEQQADVEAEAEVTALKYYKWVDEAVDTETITVYAEIKNTGNTDIIAGNAKMTFLDTDGSVISVTTDGGRIKPGYLKVGSVGYIAAEVYDDISKYDKLDKVEIELSPLPFEGDFVEFSTKDTNLNVGTWGQESAEVSVTGFLKNESDIDFSSEETTGVIGLYDENGDFIGAESMYMGQEFSIDANGETSFEIGGGSPLPPEIGEKIDSAEVKAIGVDDGEGY